MKRKQMISLLLTAIILSTASCGGEKAPEEMTENTSQAETSAPDERAERAAIPDNLPVKNYNGESFLIATETGRDKEITLEEATGDVIDDAVYERTRTVEDRFGVKIEVMTDDYVEISKKVVTSIQSGEDAFALCMTHAVQTGRIAPDDLFMNWYDVPYVDFSKPWWSDSTVDDLTVNGVCPIAVGDFVLSALGGTYCIYYNKRLAADYKLDDLYDIVNDGKWTIDKLQSIAKDAYVDLNANGKVDGDDRFGLISEPYSSMNTYLWSFGGKVLKKNSSGELELVYHNSRTNEMVQKLCSFFFDNDGILNQIEDTESSAVKYSYPIDRFLDGRALFVNVTIEASVRALRNMKDDFGILPYPKWDEAQDRYYTMVDGSHDVLAVPKTVSDPERTGIITEALCAESYKQLVPAYYETALKTKYTRDDESIAMIDMIVGSRVFDLGYIYDGFQGASFIFQNLISNNNPNFESEWASKESAVTTYYQSVIDYFENYGK